MIPDAVDVAADVGDAANVGQPVDESRLHHLDAKYASNILVSYPYIRAPLPALLAPPDVLGRT